MLDQRVAVHVGHMHVDQCQGKGLAGAGGSKHGVQSGRTARHQGRPQLPLVQRFLQDAAVGGVVVDHQHLHAIHRLRLRQHRREGRAARQSEARGEMEGAAFAELAFHPDAPVHGFHQPAGDRQSQARAAEAARGRAIGLGERIKDELQLVGRNADAGIGHREMQPGSALGPRIESDVDHHLALLGELQGIADEIDDDLPQADRVPLEHVGHVGRHVASQLQPLLVGAGRQGVERVAQVIAQAEGDGIEVQPPRLDLGKIKNVVDNGQQRMGRFLHQLQIFALLDAKAGFQDEIGHADDGVHRRTDLVAHVGQEHALGAVCRFGCFLPLLHGFLGQDAVGLVPEDPLGADHVPVRVVDLRFQDVDVDLLAVRLAVFLDDVEDLTVLGDLAVVLAILFRQVSGEQVKIGLAEEFFNGLADGPAETLVGEGEAPLQILAKDIERQCLHQRVIKGLGITHRLFGLPLFRDVGVRAGHTVGLAVGIAQGNAAGDDPAVGAIFVSQAMFETIGRSAALEVGLDRRHGPRAIFRMEAFFPFVEAMLDLVVKIAKG